nr:MAG TPA: hypothetical protein [Caudoviricetes sp.]
MCPNGKKILLIGLENRRFWCAPNCALSFVKTLTI